MSGLRQPTQTPKLSSRKPQLPSKLNPQPQLTSAYPRSPPLTTSLNSNSQSFPSGSPSHFLAPKEGSVKLKIKAQTTPEARTRLLKPASARAPSTAPSAVLTSGLRAGAGVGRAITPSDSESSLASGWGGQAYDDRGYANEVGLSDEPWEEEEVGRTESVMVTVRVRPHNAAELQRDAETVWMTSPHEPQQIKLDRGRDGEREWTYDRILPQESDNARVYATSARAHVRSAMEGFNAVIFAYGQTASGKTFTLTGSPSSPGIIPLSISDLFSGIRSTPDREFLLRASYLELYNETIIDLLSPEIGRELTLSEGKKKGEIVINGLTEMAVRTEEEVRRLLKLGEDRRKVGGTDWNARSSRSHCVFRVVIESRAHSVMGGDTPLGARTPGGRLKSAGEKMTRISTLSIIDLAGSERHTSSKERNAEGKHINQSLLTLKLVISKLADVAMKRNVSHVPYRDSKLTRLLQPSLSGDALISVICTISPSLVNQAESISTLAFASGLKKVQLRAVKKELVDPQALIQQYQNEIAELRALLREKGISGESAAGSRTEKGKNEAMEKRLEELKSLILTSSNVNEPSAGEARPLSPTKLRFPKLDYDRATGELQEDLHAAQLKMAEQEEEVARLKAELAIRPRDPDARVRELQDELDQYKLIAEDYERHLAEPSRKVREDVEKEYGPKIAKLKAALESKRIWADRLDENIRAVTAENRELKTRCQDAEAKIELIAEWINAVSDPAHPGHPQSPERLHSGDQGGAGMVPTLVVNDFSPALASTQLTLSRSGVGSGAGATFNQMDLASFSEKFGTLTMRGTSRGGAGARSGNGLGSGLGIGLGLGGKMLREESRFDLAAVGDDEVF